MNLTITHLMRRDPLPAVLVPMAFITRDDDGDYHLGTEGCFSIPDAEAEIAKAVELGSLIALAEPVPYVTDHILWLCPDGNVYLAPPTEPFDESRILVYRDETVVEAEQ